MTKKIRGRVAAVAFTVAALTAVATGHPSRAVTAGPAMSDPFMAKGSADRSAGAASPGAPPLG
jgi:hypothetical protein